MATDYRRRTLNAFLSAMKSGFNSAHQAVTSSYGVPDLDFEWLLPSRNVVLGQLDDASARVSQIIDYPGAIIYTTEALRSNRVKFAQFSGPVILVCDMILRYRLLDDPLSSSNRPDFEGDFEKYPDAAEDAMLSALTSSSSIFQSAGVNWTQYKTDRSPVVETGDGHIQRVTFTLQFEVHI